MKEKIEDNNEMIPVYLESPYAENKKDGISIEEHVEYAQRCTLDSIKRGESPYVSHLLLTQPNILKDHFPEEREKGIKAGNTWKMLAKKTVVYTDYGISDGMEEGLEVSEEIDQVVEYRCIGRNKK